MARAKRNLKCKMRPISSNALAEKRYNEFVGPFLPQIKMIARRFSEGRRDIEDNIVQTASIQILKGAERFDRTREKGPYVLRIAINAARNITREEHTYRKHFTQKPWRWFFTELEDKKNPPWNLFGSRADALKTIEQVLRGRGVGEDVLETLIFQTGIRDGRQKSLSETAEHCGIAIKTVSTRLHRLRKMLKKDLFE